MPKSNKKRKNGTIKKKQPRSLKKLTKFEQLDKNDQKIAQQLGLDKKNMFEMMQMVLQSYHKEVFWKTTIDAKLKVIDDIRDNLHEVKQVEVDKLRDQIEEMLKRYTFLEEVDNAPEFESFGKWLHGPLTDILNEKEETLLEQSVEQIRGYLQLFRERGCKDAVKHVVEVTEET